ncbi:MAG TPA: ROK family transcriptional regulator [Bacteroidota bacterium]|nr:ROK family transcriptional regulator [Bacteroidota bacterium]
MNTSGKRQRMNVNEPNEFRILRVVRDYSTISRVELAQILGLSKTTVSWLVGRLLRHGYLKNVGAGSSTVKGGRKRQLLRFNPSARYVIGVDIKLRSTQMAITDLNAAMEQRTSIEYPIGSSPDVVLGGITRGLRQWRTMKPEYFSKAVGIGIGMPGVIDEEKGVVRVADALKSWREVNLKRFFEDEFGLPTFAENDVKAMTVGEFLFGASRYIPNQVCLFVGDGVGAGIVVEGRLMRGVTSSAGEIGFNELGHTLKSSGDFPLLISDQEDLGGVVSDHRFIEVYQRHGGQRKISDAAEIVDAATAGEAIAMKIVDEAASLISMVSIQLINLLNPETIVLAGKLAGSPKVAALVQDRVRFDVLSAPAEAVQIVPAKLGSDGVLLGAVGLVLYDLFKPSRTQQNRRQPIQASLLIDDN